MGAYVSRTNRNYQPMNVTFGLLPPLNARIRDKKRKYQMISERALKTLEVFLPAVEA